MTIEQIQQLITNKADAREVINEIADYIQENPGGGGSSYLVKTEVTLTDEQIKALPTTYIEVVSAQGENTVISLVQAVIKWTKVVGYSNVNANNVFGLVYGDYDEDCSILGQMDTGITDGVSLFTPLTQVTPVATWQPYQAVGFQNSVDCINAPIKIFADNNSAGDFGGGDSGNSLKIIIYYIVTDLS